MTRDPDGYPTVPDSLTFCGGCGAAIDPTEGRIAVMPLGAFCGDCLRSGPL
jgi:hypothetical protein